MLGASKEIDAGVSVESAPHLKVYLRIVQGSNIALGPGKADLMEAIAAHGSLSKAGKALGISYRRVWDMVEAINGGFEPPLILTSHGGLKGGGTRLTDNGRVVLGLYRKMQTSVAETAAGHFEELKKYLKSVE